jgi:hypothetical protein
MTYSGKDLSKVLLRKKFKQSTGDHNFFILFDGEKKTHICTKISHGKKEYSGGLLDQVKKQLKFTNTNKMRDFFDCKLSGEGYIDMLKENGSL